MERHIQPRGQCTRGPTKSREFGSRAQQSDQHQPFLLSESSTSARSEPNPQQACPQRLERWPGVFSAQAAAATQPQ